MKRFCAGILALATAAGGLFAQEANPDAGKFSWSGSVKLGVDTVWNGPGGTPKYGQTPPASDGRDSRDIKNGVYGFHDDWNQADATVKYTKGAMQLSATIEANYANATKLNDPNDGKANTTLQGKIEYGDGINGEESNWHLQSQFRLFSTDGASIIESGGNIGNSLRRTWGYYLFLDRQLKTEIAWRGNDASLFSEPVDMVGDTNYDNLDNNAGIRVSFKPNALEGLIAGFAFHSGNSGKANAGGNVGKGTGYTVREKTPNPKTYEALINGSWEPLTSSQATFIAADGKYYPEGFTSDSPKDPSHDSYHWFTNTYPTFIDVLSSFAFGVKYDNGPLTAAAGFRTNRQQFITEKVYLDLAKVGGDASSFGTGVYKKSPGVDRVYLGGKYKIMDTLSAGLDVQLSGLSENVYINYQTDDEKKYSFAHMALGVTADFDAAPIHAGLKFKVTGDPGEVDSNFGYAAFGNSDGGIWFDPNVGKTRDTFIQVSPYVKYDIIPKTLQFHLPINIAFSANSTKDYDGELFGHDIKTDSNGMAAVTNPGNSGMYLWFAPALYYNLKGDAATDDPSCGIVLRYYIGWAFGQGQQKYKEDGTPDGDYSYDKTTTWLNGIRATFRWTF